MGVLEQIGAGLMNQTVCVFRIHLEYLLNETLTQSTACQNLTFQACGIIRSLPSAIDQVQGCR
jgi:hypothetical protein